MCKGQTANVTLVALAPALGALAETAEWISVVSTFAKGIFMDPKSSKNTVRIELTEKQKKRLREQTGQDVEAVELNIEPLEERITPRSIGRFF